MKKVITLFLILMMALCLFGCSEKEEDVPSEPLPATIEAIDQAGRTVIIKKEVERIVSLSYPISAALLALGQKDKIVAVEAKADTRPLYQLAAKELIALPSFDADKQIDTDALLKLEPDLVFLDAKQTAAADALLEQGVPAIVVDPKDYDKFIEMIFLAGAVCDVPAKAQELIVYYDKLIDEILTITDGTARPKVYIGGSSSLLASCTASMHQKQILETASARPVFAALEGNTWTGIATEQLLQWNPDYIFIPEDAVYTTEDLLNDESLAELSAIQNENIYVLPSMIESWSQPSSESILGLYWVAQTLHPEKFEDDRFTGEVNRFYKKYYNIDLENQGL